MALDVVIVHPKSHSDGPWIDDFVDASEPMRFRKVAPPAATQSWHSRGARTPLKDWLIYLRHGLSAMTSGADVVVTNFPQLAFTCCLWKMLLFRRTRVVGWSFNFGGAARSRLAPVFGRVFRAADRLIVHSRIEIDTYAEAFGLPEDKFLFVPLQRGRIELDESEAVAYPDEPYLIAMGSAQRDYGTLFDAVRDLDTKVLVIAKPEAVEGLDVPENTELRSGLSMNACLMLAKRSVLMAVPVAPTATAAGQVTFIAAMQLGVPLVATDCVGTADYLTDGETALMVDMSDPAGMRSAIARILDDPALADRLSRQAQAKWKADYSDEAAGRNLADVLRAVMPVAATPTLQQGS